MTDNKDGWIEWKGGECPVDGLVHIKCRDGWDTSVTGREPVNAFDLYWGHGSLAWGSEGEILAYRLAQPLTYQHEDGKPAADMEEF